MQTQWLHLRNLMFIVVVQKFVQYISSVHRNTPVHGALWPGHRRVYLLMTFCSYKSFLSQTDWRSLTELPTSHKISRLDFTCKLESFPWQRIICVYELPLSQGWVSRWLTWLCGNASELLTLRKYIEKLQNKNLI